MTKLYRNRGRSGPMRLVAMAVTFLLLTALPEAVGEIASVPRPAYSLGDFWLYRLNSTEAGFFTLNGTMNVTVGAFSGFPANGTPVVEMLFEGEGTPGEHCHAEWDPKEPYRVA